MPLKSLLTPIPTACHYSTQLHELSVTLLEEGMTWSIIEGLLATGKTGHFLTQWEVGVCFPMSSQACAVVKITDQFACTVVSVPCRGWSTSNALITANKWHYLVKQEGELSERNHANFSQIWKKITVWNGHDCILLHTSTESNQPNKTFLWF